MHSLLKKIGPFLRDFWWVSGRKLNLELALRYHSVTGERILVDYTSVGISADICYFHPIMLLLFPFSHFSFFFSFSFSFHDYFALFCMSEPLTPTYAVLPFEYV